MNRITRFLQNDRTDSIIAPRDSYLTRVQVHNIDLSLDRLSKLRLDLVQFVDGFLNEAFHRSPPDKRAPYECLMSSLYLGGPSGFVEAVLYKDA